MKPYPFRRIGIFLFVIVLAGVSSASASKRRADQDIRKPCGKNSARAHFLRECKNDRLAERAHHDGDLRRFSNVRRAERSLKPRSSG